MSIIRFASLIVFGVTVKLDQRARAAKKRRWISWTASASATHDMGEISRLGSTAMDVVAAKVAVSNCLLPLPKHHPLMTMTSVSWSRVVFHSDLSDNSLTRNSRCFLSLANRFSSALRAVLMLSRPAPRGFEHLSVRVHSRVRHDTQCPLWVWLDCGQP